MTRKKINADLVTIIVLFLFLIMKKIKSCCRLSHEMHDALLKYLMFKKYILNDDAVWHTSFYKAFNVGMALLSPPE